MILVSRLESNSNYWDLCVELKGMETRSVEILCDKVFYDTCSAKVIVLQSQVIML